MIVGDTSLNILMRSSSVLSQRTNLPVRKRWPTNSGLHGRGQIIGFESSKRKGRYQRKRLVVLWFGHSELNDSVRRYGWQRRKTTMQTETLRQRVKFTNSGRRKLRYRTDAARRNGICRTTLGWTHRRIQLCQPGTWPGISRHHCGRVSSPRPTGFIGGQRNGTGMSNWKRPSINSQRLSEMFASGPTTGRRGRTRISQKPRWRGRNAVVSFLRPLSTQPVGRGPCHRRR